MDGFRVGHLVLTDLIDRVTSPIPRLTMTDPALMGPLITLLQPMLTCFPIFDPGMTVDPEPTMLWSPMETFPVNLPLFESRDFE